MTEKYCQTLYAEIRKRIEDVSSPLLNNGINSFDHYKHISGIKVGLEEALLLAQQTYKKMYDVQYLNEARNGVEHERRSSEREEEGRFY